MSELGLEMSIHQRNGLAVGIYGAIHSAWVLGRNISTLPARTFCALAQMAGGKDHMGTMYPGIYPPLLILTPGARVGGKVGV